MGMAAANPGKAAILVAGFAEAVAGAIAMGGGSASAARQAGPGVPSHVALSAVGGSVVSAA
jgi:hypothetical protein